MYVPTASNTIVRIEKESCDIENDGVTTRDLQNFGEVILAARRLNWEHSVVKAPLELEVAWDDDTDRTDSKHRIRRTIARGRAGSIFPQVFGLVTLHRSITGSAACGRKSINRPPLVGELVEMAGYILECARSESRRTG